MGSWRDKLVVHRNSPSETYVLSVAPHFPKTSLHNKFVWSIFSAHDKFRARRTLQVRHREKEVWFSLSQRKEKYSEYVLKATLPFLRILINSNTFCLERLSHKSCMPSWTWLLHLLLLATAANSWFRPATYQIIMLVESFNSNKINACKPFG